MTVTNNHHMAMQRIALTASKVEAALLRRSRGGPGAGGPSMPVEELCAEVARLAGALAELARTIENGIAEVKE
ncbi:MAG: hypothetical protein HY901_36000 [Deltaproteobacteria bacterium]|nr:hypothetical protein [Deltaproteobacteria bacterium]